MALVADRFLTLDACGCDALDLATGDRVRLFVDAHASPADVRARAAVCDRLATLRHPLLLPLLDYGTSGTGGCGAHAPAARVRLSSSQRRRWVLHLVRFLRDAGVELTAQWTARNIRTALGGAAAAGRPLGVILRDRAAVDAIRTVLESAGPPRAAGLDPPRGQGAGRAAAPRPPARA